MKTLRLKHSGSQPRGEGATVVLVGGRPHIHGHRAVKELGLFWKQSGRDIGEEQEVGP